MLIALRERFPGVTFVPADDAETLAREVADADAFYGFVFPPELIAQAPRLRWVQSISAGVERQLAELPPEVGVSNGAGIAAGAIAEHVIGVMLAFCRQRFATRGRTAQLIDLKERSLPDAAFDFVTAMDVFEHLVDPAAALDTLARALRPGGIMYGRFAAEDDSDRPQHIVHDFAPLLERFAQLGFVEIFRDDWSRKERAQRERRLARLQARAERERAADAERQEQARRRADRLVAREAAAREAAVVRERDVHAKAQRRRTREREKAAQQAAEQQAEAASAAASAPTRKAPAAPPARP